MLQNVSSFYRLVDDHQSAALVPTPTPPFALHPFLFSTTSIFWKAPSRSILSLAQHHTLISFLIYRLIIRMSLQCPHWAAGGVIEQHKRHLKEGWIIELERGGEWRAGLRPAISGVWLLSGGIHLGIMVNHVYVNLIFLLQHIRLNRYQHSSGRKGENQ